MAYITGFGHFQGVPNNPSEALVSALAQAIATAEIPNVCGNDESCWIWMGTNHSMLTIMLPV
jgi:hypothetical protein